MPEAIATTKRKFHKLLDTLSSYANAPVEPQTPLTARQKLEQASERVRKRQKQDGSLSSIESRLKSVSTTSLPHKVPARAVKGDKELPNFSPWSYERFSQRLQTFSKVSLWHPKPERIDEVAWAKRGWSCVEVNTVACVGGCNRRVIVQTAIPTRQTEDEDEEDDTALEEALTIRYEDEITNGHSENCLWRKAGCKDDIYRMQVVRPAVWQPALKERYSSLLAIHPSVQDVKIKADVDVSRLRDELVILPPSDLPTEVQDKALHIAMQGWHGCSELGADLLKCNTCFQRVGLWMYQPGYRSKDEDDDEVLLDLSAMHREYCPWRSAKSQQATGSLEGLSAAEILAKVVQVYIREKRRKTEDYKEQENIPEPAVDSPKLSREEVEQADKERETRLQRLKRMLSVKKTPKCG